MKRVFTIVDLVIVNAVITMISTVIIQSIVNGDTLLAWLQANATKQ